MARIYSTLMFTLGVCVVVGCNPAQKAAPKPSPTACADYAKKVCDEAGAESPTCKTMTDATAMMAPAVCASGITEFAFTKTKLGDARKACDDLITKLCAEVGPTTETCDMVKTQTKNFPSERCTTMLEHLPEIVADLKKREERNKPLPAEKMAAILQPGAPSFGPEGAAVTVVEFSDFQCPFCSRTATATAELKKKYGDRVRFVFRQFPLNFHQQARLAAEASLAANAQGKFWEYHDKLFADQSKLERPALEEAAKSVGLNMSAFKQALDNKTFAAAVDADMKLGELVSVDGTPTMFINGARVADPTNVETISQLIEAAIGKQPG